MAALAALAPALVMPLPQMRWVDWKEYPWEDIRSVQYFSLPIEALFMRVEVGENNTLGQTLPALVLVSLALTGKRREHLESAFERTGGAVEDKRPLAAAYDYFVFEPAR